MPLSRALRGLAAIGIVAAITLAPSAAHASAPMPAVAALDAAGLPVLPAGVDDFTFASFSGDYSLGRDSDNRSTLDTTETLVAVFPDYDQNRGIIRAIPLQYDGHPTDIQVLSVADGTGQPRSYDIGTSDDGDFMTVTIAVPKGSYVHGRQTYVIRYTQTDVTKYFSNTDNDEFYWDTNGTGWAQPFGTVTATVHVDPSLTSALDGSKACYYGDEGSTDRCDVGGQGDTITASVHNLDPYQNMTVAVGFAAHTFAGRPFSITDSVGWAGTIGGGAGILSLVVAFLSRFIGLRDAKGTGIVIPQYEPPAGVSAFTAANIIGQAKKGAAATIVDLAVRRKIVLVEGEKGLFHSSKFGVVPTGDTSDLLPDELSMLTAVTAGAWTPPGLVRLVGGGASTPPSSIAAPGTTATATAPQVDPDAVRWLDTRDQSLARVVVSLTNQAGTQAVTAGLRRTPSLLAKLPVYLLAAIGVLVGSASLVLFNGGISDAVGIIPGFVAFTLIRTRRPLTVEGAKLKEYLDGLKLFIQYAEADRLKMLQSVTGAERIDTSNGTQVVKIYERLLPYAVLFGQEKEWANTLAVRYDGSEPGWYYGNNGVFLATNFAANMALFSTSVASSYSGTATSSSSGGSFGGGFSGGGGGGGGGGGI